MGALGKQDKLVLAEYDAYLAYLLAQTSEARQNARFYNAIAFEENHDEKLEYYAEIEGNEGKRASSKKVASYKKKLKDVQMKWRDPKEVEAEQAKGAFDAWKKSASEAFAKEWDSIRQAVAAAKPKHDEGMIAVEAQEYDKALKALQGAREALFKKAYPSAVALDAAVANGTINKGLSYEIAAGIARIHFERGDLAKLYPELAIIQVGRPWLDQAKELEVRLYDILGDRDGKMAPKATELVKRYAGRYSGVQKQWKLARQAADARTGEAYNMLGVALETIKHRSAGSDPEGNAGKVVFVEEPVTAMSGKSLRFELERSYKVATKCWSTGKVDRGAVHERDLGSRPRRGGRADGACDAYR